MDLEPSSHWGTPTVYCTTCVYKYISNYMHTLHIIFVFGPLSLSLNAVGMCTHPSSALSQNTLQPGARDHVSRAASFKPTLYSLFSKVSLQEIAQLRRHSVLFAHENP